MVSSVITARCDALLARADVEAAIGQRVLSMRQRNIDPQAWSIVLSTCEAANVRGRQLAASLSPPGTVVPEGDGPVFLSIVENGLIAEALRVVGFPPEVQQAFAQPVPPRQVAIVCVVEGGAGVLHQPFVDRTVS